MQADLSRTNARTGVILLFVNQFESAKKRFEDHNSSYYEKLVATGYSYSVQTEYEALESTLLATPARTLADVAYKVEMTRWTLDEIGDVENAIPLLDRALTALKARKAKTAIAALIAVLTDNHEYSFEYDGAIAALADLRRMEAAL